MPVVHEPFARAQLPQGGVRVCAAVAARNEAMPLLKPLALEHREHRLQRLFVAVLFAGDGIGIPRI